MTDPGLTVVPDPTSGIRISRATIRNFRCIDELQVDLEPGTTYLVGENNAGKTSVLLALWSALGSRRPLDYDLRRDVDDRPAAEASVDVLVVPSDGERFSTELRQRLLSVQRDPSTRTETVAIRTVFQSSRAGNVLSTRRLFLQPDRDGAWTPVAAPRLPPDLMNRLEAHFSGCVSRPCRRIGQSHQHLGQSPRRPPNRPTPGTGRGTPRTRASSRRPGPTRARLQPGLAHAPG